MKFSPENTHLICLVITVLTFFTLQVLAFVAEAQTPFELMATDKTLGFNNLSFAKANHNKDFKNRNTHLCNHDHSKNIENSNNLIHRNRSEEENYSTYSQASAVFVNDSLNECANIDFEESSFDNWEGLYGYVEETNGLPIVESAGFEPSQTNITNTSGGYDPIALSCGINIPVAFEGGHSVRLGDADGGFEVNWLRREIAVTEENSLLLLHYAVLLENPDHEEWEQPRFSIRLLDEGGTILPCGDYAVTAADGVPGFQSCGTWEIRNWTSDAIILTPFIGTNVILEIMVADCAQGAHGGYAYVEAECIPFSLLSNDFCPGENIDLSIPDVFAAYQWSTAPEDTTNSITVSNASANDAYDLTLTSVTGCQATITFNVPNPPQVATNGITASPVAICPGDSVILSVAGEHIHSIYWDELSVYGNPVVVGPTETTVYNCTIEDSLGCVTLYESVEVIVGPPDELSILQSDTTICYGEGLVLNTLYTGPYQLYWETPLGIYADSVTVYPTETTTYQVYSTDPTACVPDTAEVSISVLNPPTMTFSITGDTICQGETAFISITGENIAEIIWEEVSFSGYEISVDIDTTTFYPFTIAGIDDCEVVETGVWVLVNPVNPIQYETDTVSICPNESAFLEIIGTNIGEIQWQHDGSNSNSVVVAPTETTFYPFTIYDLYDCSFVVDSFLVEFKEQDVLNIQPDNILDCFGATVTIIADYSGTADLYWDGYGYIGDTLEIEITASTVINVTTNDASSCAPESVDVSIDILNPTPLDYGIEDVYICPGESAVLTITGSNTGEIFWPETGQSGTSITIDSIMGDANIPFSVNDEEQCEYFVEDVWVYVLDAPEIEYNNSTLSVCPGESVTLSISDPSISSVEWTGFPPGPTIVVAPDSTTAFEFTAWDIYNCSSVLDSIIVEFTEQSLLELSANNLTICEGESVTISANYSGNADLFWDNGFEYAGDSIVAYPIQTTTYSVITNDVTSCAPDQAFITIEVLASPVIQYQANNVSICPGESVELSVDGNWSSILWAEGSSTEANITVAPLISQYYYFSLNGDLPCGGIEDSIYVGVNAVNELSFSQDTATICQGESIAIQMIYDGTAPLIWEGSPDLGPNFTLTPDSSISITVSSTDTSFCAPIPITLDITVLEAEMDYEVQDLSFCLGETVPLNIEGSNIGSVYWPSLNAEGNNISITPTESGIYPVQLTDLNECSVVLDTIELTLIEQFQLNISASSETICQGETLTLNANYNGSLPLYWPELGDTAQTVSFIPDSSGLYSVLPLGESACGNPTDSIYITVVHFPPIYYQTETVSVCQGDLASIDLEAENYGSFTWLNFEADEPMMEFVPSQDTILYFEITDLAFCNTITDSIQVMVNEAYTLNINQSDTAICIGEPIELSVFYNGNTPIEWHGVNSQNSVVIDTPMTTTTYVVYALDSGNCAPPADSITVTVLEPPIMEIEIQEEQLICLGDSATLTVMGTDFGTVIWPSIPDTGYTVSVSPDTTTTYLVLINDIFECNAVLDSFVVNVNVTQLPVVSPERGDTLICEGDTAILSITGENVAEVQWLPNGPSTPLIEVTPIDDTWYGFEVWDSLGCQVIEDSVFVKVQSLPVIELIEPEPSICQHDTFTITATGIDIDTFTWLNQNVFGSSIDVFPDSTTSYFVQGTDIIGCKSDIEEFEVTVIIPPEMSYSITPLEACLNDTIQVSVDGEFIGATYWTESGLSTNSIPFVALNSTEVEVEIIDFYGCDTIVEQIPIMVNPLPEVQINQESTSVCEGELVTLEVLNSNINEIINWINFNEIGNQVSFVAEESTIVQVEVIDENSCHSLPKEIVIDVDALPELFLENESFVLCLGEEISIELESSDSDLSQIFLNEEPKGTNTIIEYVPLESELIEIRAVDESGCLSETIVIPIEVQTPPVLELGPDRCVAGPLELNVENPGATYVWQDGSTSSSYTIEYSDYYTVEVENACGKLSDSLSVVIDGCQFRMSTGFSPNGDGQNDYFGPINTCYNDSYKDLEFRVFNRWGQKVFEGYNANEVWDGVFGSTISEMGVYVWQLTYYSETCERWFEQKGNVTLIR